MQDGTCKPIMVTKTVWCNLLLLPCSVRPEGPWQQPWCCPKTVSGGFCMIYTFPDPDRHSPPETPEVSCHQSGAPLLLFPIPPRKNNGNGNNNKKEKEKFIKDKGR